jgi:hypothetical protein
MPITIIGWRVSSLELLGGGSSLHFGSQVRSKGKPHRQHICACSRIVCFPSTELRILGERESPVKILGEGLPGAAGFICPSVQCSIAMRGTDKRIFMLKNPKSESGRRSPGWIYGLRTNDGQSRGERAKFAGAIQLAKMIETRGSTAREL